jgi:hypothetical protein
MALGSSAIDVEDDKLHLAKDDRAAGIMQWPERHRHGSLVTA